MASYNHGVGSPVVFVAIDIAKARHEVLIEAPDGKRKRLAVANCKTDFDDLVATLRCYQVPCHIAFEATGDYHRPLASVLGRQDGSNGMRLEAFTAGARRQRHRWRFLGRLFRRR